MKSWFEGFKKNEWWVQGLQISAAIFALTLWCFMGLPSMTYVNSAGHAYDYPAYLELFVGSFPLSPSGVMPAFWSVIGYVLTTVGGLCVSLSVKRNFAAVSLIFSGMGLTLIALQPIATMLAFSRLPDAESNSFGLGYIMPLVCCISIVVIGSILFVKKDLMYQNK